MSDLFRLDREKLLTLAAERSPAYAAARPFPHTVIDNFLPEEVLGAVLDEFPKPGDIDWWAFDDARERKLGTTNDRAMGPVTRLVLAELNSATAVDFLQELTGIRGLVPDPHLYGGGLHQIEPGGFLKVHADFNLHPLTRLERRLNLLVYLNRDWKANYGGALELWDSTMTSCEDRIEPLFNRCVVFTTSEHSFHGHPSPLTCPSGSSRKSLALYYYSAPRVVDGRLVEHNTVFRGRPGEELGDSTPGPAHESGRAALHQVAVRWLPPVVTERVRGLRARKS